MPSALSLSTAQPAFVRLIQASFDLLCVRGSIALSGLCLRDGSSAQHKASDETMQSR